MAWLATARRARAPTPTLTPPARSMRRWAKASAVNAPPSATTAAPSQIHDAWRKLRMPANNSARLPATARVARSRPASPRTSQIQRRHLTMNAHVRIAHGVGARPALTAISGPGPLRTGPVRQRDADDDHAILEPGRRAGRDPADQAADREGAGLHEDR